MKTLSGKEEQEAISFLEKINLIDTFK